MSFAVPTELFRAILSALTCLHAAVVFSSASARAPGRWMRETALKIVLARRTIVAGCSMYLDTRVWTFHVENGIMYVPGSSAYALVDGKPEKRPIAPTAPFAEPRNYGPKVDAARRESTGLSDADVPRAKAEWMALVKAKVATDPLIATRFRAPTEEELASVSLGGIRMAPNTRSAGRPSVAPA